MALTPDDIFKAHRDIAIRNRSDRSRYNKYTPRRVDRNQPAIVKDFRQLGIQVTHIHSVGEGVFDLLCAYRYLVVSVEIKDGLKSPSARKFTDPQRDWAKSWGGLKAVACNTSDVVRIAEQMKAIVRSCSTILGDNPRIIGNQEEQYQL